MFVEKQLITYKIDNNLAAFITPRMNRKEALYRGFSVFLVLFLGIIKANAQNSIMVQTPPNDFRLEDLWNITINKDASGPYDTYFIDLKIFDNSKGLLVALNTKNFTVPSNTQVFSSATISALTPFNYTYSGSSAIEDISRRGGLFPAGDYKFEYSLYGNSGGSQTKLADASISHSVIMPSFLQLISVFDKDTLKEENPTFMWLPASATKVVGSFETEKEYKLTYTISVAEVYTNQTPYMAITSNPKFFTQEKLDNTLLTYPFSARKFEPCKTYAWQVRGVVNGQTVISSEIWIFKTPCKKEEVVPTVPVLVKQNVDLATCYVSNNTIYFAYYEEYEVSEGAVLNAKIYDTKSGLVADENQLSLLVKKGYNTFTVNTCPAGANLLNGNNYQMVITNSKNEKWYLRIVNNQSTNTCY